MVGLSKCAQCYVFAFSGEAGGYAAGGCHHRVRRSTEGIATETIVVPLLWGELRPNPLVQTVTGNVSVIGAQKRTFRMNDEMLERRKCERHCTAAF
jgi:hypothetical protein